jgi:hypothetical protein
MTFATRTLRTAAIAAGLSLTALAGAASATSGALGGAAPTPGQGFQPGYIQTIDVTSRLGASQMDQIYNAGTGASNITRVCMVNLGSVSRSFTHAVPGVNALSAPSGGQSCANFSADSRVAFGMVDGVEPATPGVAMVMSLGFFAGGTVTFLWR